MAKINNKDLEKALNSGKKVENLKTSGAKDNSKGIEMPRDIEIGFHQGALNTLINERNELIKMIQQVEMVMQAHLKRLEEMGVKVKTGSEE